MWTPSVQSDDYWFRLQYDPETAIFEDISALLLKPSSSESVNSCRICEHFSKQNAKSVLSCSGLELQPATTWSMKYVSSIQCLQKTEDSLDSYNDYTAPQNCIARRICCRFQMTCLHSRSCRKEKLLCFFTSASRRWTIEEKDDLPGLGSGRRVSDQVTLPSTTKTGSCLTTTYWQPD